jgi:hypothetical protein
MALDHVKHVEAVAIIRAVSEQAAFRALPLELQQAVEGWLEENHPRATVYSAAMRAMLIQEAASRGVPMCPVCGAEAVKGESQQITRIPTAMVPLQVEAGVVVYTCANGHFHDGERETGPLPEDITIREGM